MRRPLALSAAFLVLGLAACGTQESSLTSDQQAVLATLSDSATAWSDENPGGDGAVTDASPAAPAPAGIFLAPGDTFHFPAGWGRIRRANAPTRTRTVTVTGDTAQVVFGVTFNGVLKVDTTFDGIIDPGTKPLLEQAAQSALFVRDSLWPHGWRLAGLTVRRFQNSDPAKRTVNITSVSVQRNSDAAATLTDPDLLLSPETLTSVSVGDTLTVVVQATNTTGTDLVPPTQMFIHVRHLLPGTDAWARFPMQLQDDGSWKAHWVVRRSGAAVIGVDAIDSETLSNESADDYRSDLWAVPVRVQ